MKKIIGISIIAMSVLIVFGTFSVAHAQPWRDGYRSVDGTGGIVACSGADSCGYDTLIKTIQNIVDVLIVLATGIATIVFAWAGFLYLTAAGNASKISKAHGLIWTAVIGFLVALAAGLIVEVIVNSLGADKFIESVMIYTSKNIS